MIKPIYQFNFRIRTLLYLFIGILCASLDFFSFLVLSTIISPFYSNPIGYILGSICSYNLNKRYTFKSSNSKLSLRRYLMIILIGLFSSQLIIFVGINLFEFNEHLSSLKLIAMLMSALTQYLGNTFFGSKRNNNVK
tara:strand:+ start:134 stop:544 length:411 start_codon:yes stop_codon:yes gene_type:complete